MIEELTVQMLYLPESEIRSLAAKVFFSYICDLFPSCLFVRVFMSIKKS